MSQKAIAYTADITLGRSGEVITRAAQKETIEKYARENHIEIVAWFEDEGASEDIGSRQGVQKMLAQATSCDTILVERVWSLSRNWPRLREFVTQCKARNLQVTATTTLWDCVSQMCRNEVRPEPVRLMPARPVVYVEATVKSVHRPKRLHFLQPAHVAGRV
jgi:DNA invertase Pin-like site-specific DNA recombinase